MANFNFIVPLKKDANNLVLTGIASATSLDRDEERMSDSALDDMVSDIRKEGVNLFENHLHNWENTLGVITSASKTNDRKVAVSINLDDPTTNPKIPMMLNKLSKGIKLGLSVGGNVTASHWEFDKTLNKKVKVMDKVKIYEVSVVGIPSNADSYLTIPQAIAKSAKFSNPLNLIKCPNCYTDTEENECPICLTKLFDFEKSFSASAQSEAAELSAQGFSREQIKLQLKTQFPEMSESELNEIANSVVG
jgi:HK97 family phage prohead protease